MKMHERCAMSVVVLAAVLVSLCACPAGPLPSGPSPSPGEPALSSLCALTELRFEAADNPAVLDADLPAHVQGDGSFLAGPLGAGTAVGALVARFELSAGACARVDGRVQEPGRTENDFTQPLVYEVRAEDGSIARYLVRVLVEDFAPAPRLLSFSVCIGNRVYDADIAELEDPPAIRVRLPSTACLGAPLVASFSLSDPEAEAFIGDASQESGITENDFSLPLEYRLRKEGALKRRYRLSLEPNPVLCALREFCVSPSSVYAQAGQPWIDLALLDSGALGSGWSLRSASGGSIAVLIASGDPSGLPPAALVDGALLRVHGPGFSESDEGSPADRGAPDVWDLVAAAQPFPDRDHGLLWIQTAHGTVVDALAWRRSGVTGSWLEGAGMDALAAAVAACQWPSAEASDAFVLEDAERFTGRLSESLPCPPRDGNEASHWESWQAPFARLASAGVSPEWATLTAELGARVRVEARLESLGLPHPPAVLADLSALGGPSAAPLRDDGLEGDACAADGTWTLDWDMAPGIVEEGWRTIAVSAQAAVPVSSLQASFVLSPLPPPEPKPLIDGGDMETEMALATKHAIVGWEETVGRDGSPTRALHISGSLGANATILLTSANCAARSLGFSRAGFLLRCPAGGIPKAINLEFGTATTGIAGGQLFRLTSDWNTDAAFTASGSSFLYTATPGADSGGAWVKACLDVSGTDTARPLLLRLGSGVYDFWIDDLVIEP